MLKNFSNFVNESGNVVVNSYTIKVRDVLNSYKGNWEFTSMELNKKLLGREIRIHEMAYDRSHNQFKWVKITPEYYMFNSIKKIKDDWYIIFDDDCMVKLDSGLSIEHRIMLFDF